MSYVKVAVDGYPHMRYTYYSDWNVKVGQRVLVPFGYKNDLLEGTVTNLNVSVLPSIHCKPIDSLLPPLLPRKTRVVVLTDDTRNQTAALHSADLAIRVSKDGTARIVKDRDESHALLSPAPATYRTKMRAPDTAPVELIQRVVKHLQNWGSAKIVVGPDSMVFVEATWVIGNGSYPHSTYDLWEIQRDFNAEFPSLVLPSPWPIPQELHSW